MNEAGREHQLSRKCWCRPGYVPATGLGMDGPLVVVHQAPPGYGQVEERAEKIRQAILEIGAERR